MLSRSSQGQGSREGRTYRLLLLRSTRRRHVKRCRMFLEGVLPLVEGCGGHPGGPSLPGVGAL